ncbi:MAG: hypothetical protein JO321_17490 [Solirubrobacterales bacterium]|nr:hypothetical protein [Solirubrobacterales bacterium]MBV9537195.1 hypothetical protein [Solirubrobacterales bacterium]
MHWVPETAPAPARVRFKLVIFPLTLLYSDTAAISALARRIKAGTPIDQVCSLRRFEASLDLIGMGEACELEQRLAET